MKTPVLIVGGGTGGVAAALALASRSIPCILTEPTDWIGGQLTSQAVPPDENRWIEGKDNVQSATRSYLAYRNGVRALYRSRGGLTPAALAEPHLNPGNGWVSDLCHEPALGHAVLQSMLAPHVASGLITILLHTSPIAADVNADALRSVTVQNSLTGQTSTISADYFLDATELGDLLKLSSTEYFAGAEHTSVHGELHGRPDKSDPHDIQAISWCFALEHRPNEDHTIPRPPNYTFWRDYVPPLTPPWSGKLFSWTQIGGNEHKPRTFRFLPHPAQPDDGEWEMWRYRRIVDTSLYTNPAAHPDVALINMVQMDYFLTPTLEVSEADRLAAFAAAKNQSLCFVHWMQTEAPRLDGTDAIGFPGLKLRGNELGTTDGFAKHPYIRESRRLDALSIVSERHVGTEQRLAEGLTPPPTTSPDAAPLGIGECWSDSVGIGHYRLDLHPSTAFRNSIYVHAAPFRIPLGALIPKRVVNLLAAGKCLGVTHITNGCFRLHPTEWNIGESAAHTAAYCLVNHLPPHALHASLPHTRTLQSQLTTSGIPLSWPWENHVNL